MKQTLLRFVNKIFKERGFIMEEKLRQIGLTEEQIAAVSKVLAEVGSFEEQTGELERLRKEVEDYKDRFKEVSADRIIEDALRNAGAKSIKACKALIDMDSLEFDGKNVIGLDEQIKKLASDEETAFLFEKKGSFKLKGVKPRSSAGKAGAKDFSSFKYDDWDEYFRKNK